MGQDQARQQAGEHLQGTVLNRIQSTVTYQTRIRFHEPTSADWGILGNLGAILCDPLQARSVPRSMEPELRPLEDPTRNPVASIERGFNWRMSSEVWESEF